MTYQTALVHTEVMESLKDKISTKIRNEFVELIPDETWKNMVDNEIIWL